jgi:hypothetical protein
MRQNHLDLTEEQREEVMRDKFDRFVWLGSSGCFYKNCGLKSGEISPLNRGADT